MPGYKRILLSWSSGKDSAWALHLLRQQGQGEVVGLLSTLNQTFNRVAMHGVRRALLEAQAQAAGLPLIIAPLPWPCSNQQYEHAMQQALQQAVETLGITHVAFGDLFLADIRAYREEKLAQHTSLAPLFPVWNIPTPDLAQQMLQGGLRARIACVDLSRLPASFAGREYDSQLLQSLPQGVDPCGENGEFHTFAYSGPMFSHPIDIKNGESVQRDGFCFTDLLPNCSPPDCPLKTAR